MELLCQLLYPLSFLGNENSKKYNPNKIFVAEMDSFDCVLHTVSPTIHPYCPIIHTCRTCLKPVYKISFRSLRTDILEKERKKLYIQKQNPWKKKNMRNCFHLFLLLFPLLFDLTVTIAGLTYVDLNLIHNFITCENPTN